MNKPRLIEAGSLLELYDGLEDKGLMIPIDVLIQNIKDEPTAYDIDKVIKRFEETFDSWGLDEGKKELMRDIVKGGAK